MRYLTIAADYTQSCLHDDFEGPITPEALKLSGDLCTELHSWNDLYKQVIPLDMEQRAQNSIVALIEILDQQGMLLAEKVRLSVKGDAKIRYFSEGKLIYLTP